MKKLIKALKRSGELREQFLRRPLFVAKKFGVQLTTKQIRGLEMAKEFELDPLLRATMCPKSSGYEEISLKKSKKAKK